MSIDPNDPRLTTYVLGELEGEEHTEIEKAIQYSEELRQAVAEIRETAASLTEELQRELLPGLSEAHQQKIESGLRLGASGSVLLRKKKWVAAAALAAACLVLAVNLGPELQSPSSDEQVMTRVYSSEKETDSLVSGSLDTKFGDAKDEVLMVPQEKPLRYEQTGQIRGNEVPGPPGSREKAGRDSQEGEVKQPKAQLFENKPFRAPVANILGGKSKNDEISGAGGQVGQDASRVIGLEKGALSHARPSAERAREAGEHRYFAADSPRPDAIRGSSKPDFNTEAYDRIVDNRFLEVTEHPLSTFSIDVDTASYSNVRRFLRQGTLPPKDAVRIEEMLNYFSYAYPAPSKGRPFSVNVEVAQAPWNFGHRLVRVGLKGMEIHHEKRPASNLVFLLDVSGSMRPTNKLPLMKKALRLLLDRLGENDQVAIVVYAGASGLVLPSTSGDQKGKLRAALENLEAGGSTNGGSGIQLAYRTAVANFAAAGTNRVILATDGDFNVGVTNQGDLTRLIEEKAQSGVFLSVLGFGMGNYKDSTLEKLADMGNGNYAYIDDLNEARKVLVDQIDSTLVTIAKDVKIQIEFNPTQVSAYRLIGYENRLLRKEDFNDDTKDAGEIGAGHSVTALYEVVPTGGRVDVPDVDPLKYQKSLEATEASASDELLTLKLRYKEPDRQKSRVLEFPIRDRGASYGQASQDFKFAAAVACFGMILRDSPYKGNATLDAVLELAQEGRGSDPHGYRQQFVELAKKAKTLDRAKPVSPR